MNVPYGLMSDQHCHNWSAFSTVDSAGRNSRLMQIIYEIDRACETVIRMGGRDMLGGGDLFHLRGSVSPEVFNPVRECIERNIKKGIRFHFIAGNHDLTGDDSDELGSAIKMLEQDGFEVIHSVSIIELEGGKQILAVPWIKNIKKLKEEVEKASEKLKSIGLIGDMDLLIHGGIDGSIKGMPDHHLTADWLATLGFQHVWSGHYHNAHDFGSNVFSIGSPTQQTWGDIGTRAGWWTVDSAGAVKFFASHAPEFIELDGSEKPEELPLIVDRKYVRAKIGAATAKEVMAWRKALTDAGATAAVIHSVPSTAATKRASSAPKSISSLRQSVSDYCEERTLSAEAKLLALEILTESETA